MIARRLKKTALLPEGDAFRYSLYNLILQLSGPRKEDFCAISLQVSSLSGNELFNMPAKPHICLILFCYQPNPSLPFIIAQLVHIGFNILCKKKNIMPVLVF